MARELVDIIIVQGTKDLAKIKAKARKQGWEINIRRSGKEGRSNLYTVKVYKR